MGGNGVLAIAGSQLFPGLLPFSVVKEARSLEKLNEFPEITQLIVGGRITAQASRLGPMVGLIN